MADLCRVCLCNDRKVYAFNNSVLKEVWEKLTNAKLDNNDGKPIKVCYICYANLRKSYQLMQKASKAEVFLKVLVKHGLQHQHNAISKIAGLTPDFNCSYVITKPFLYECTIFRRSKKSKIKKEIEENNDEENGIHIKEEEDWSDSSQEENLDNVGIEPEADDNAPNELTLEQLLEKEVRVVLERIDLGPQRRKRKLNKVPQNVERNNLDETNNPWETLGNANPKSLPNNCKASDISSSKRKALKHNVENSESIQITNSVNTGKFRISPNVCALQNAKAYTDLVSHTGAENEISTLNVPKRTKAVVKPASNGENKTNIRNRELSENNDLRLKRATKAGIKKHTKEKPFICQLCDYRSSTKGYLKTHIQYKHTKEKKFSCDICQYRFVRRVDLNTHLKTHSDAKPNICDFCGYRCSRKSSLIRHMQFKHTKEKKFSCDICQFKCVEKSKLVIHIRTHTKEKPFKCSLCNYRCSRKDGISTHMQNKHSKEKNFSCHMCQYKSFRKYKLIVHLRRHT